MSKVLLVKKRKFNFYLIIPGFLKLLFSPYQEQMANRKAQMAHVKENQYTCGPLSLKYNC